MAERSLANLPELDMIKFAKNGPEATKAAVKLARAFTGRKLFANKLITLIRITMIGSLDTQI